MQQQTTLYNHTDELISIRVLLKMPLWYTVLNVDNFFSPCGSTAQFLTLAASTKLYVSFQFLDLGQSAGHLGGVISSSQDVC
jgi:hypothetical protein